MTAHTTEGTFSDMLWGPIDTRRSIITTTVVRRDEVLICYGFNGAYDPELLSPEHDAEHTGYQWVPVDALREENGRRYFRFARGHSEDDWVDIPIDDD